MAVKKKTEDVEVIATKVKEPEVKVEEPVLDIPVVEEVKEEPKKKEEPIVEVDATPVDKSNAVESTVRVKMRENHRCCIAGEYFVLLKGQCYNVPKEVKMRLSKAGLLLPL